MTQPLLSSISSLLTQRNSLCSLLRDKDLELEDLRGGGATLSLPKLEMKRFALESFLEDQRADTIKDPMDFLINKDVVGIMSMGKVTKKQRNGAEKDEVDINQKKNVDNSPQSKPVMLSSKRVITRPDLSKYKDDNKSSKKAKLNKL